MRVAALVLAFLAAGCSSFKMDSACTYTREVKTSYICQPDGKVEHIRIAPGGSPEP